MRSSRVLSRAARMRSLRRGESAIATNGRCEGEQSVISPRDTFARWYRKYPPSSSSSPQDDLQVRSTYTYRTTTTTSFLRMKLATSNIGCALGHGAP